MRERFEHVASLRGLSAEWRLVPEGPDADPALHARYADLTILGQLDPDRGEAEMLRPRPEQVTFASGRPMLVVPYAGHFETVGQRIVIAWNATREAARAVHDALPLLSAAETVIVLTIDAREGPERAWRTARCGYLAAFGEARRQGASRAHRLGRSSGGEVLLSRAADLGADLLVMGAYGHSRMRELLLGGVTRSLLHSMTVPVLMSH